MARKSVEKLLKGVLITGTAVGGASIMGDARIAYAQTLDFNLDGEIVTPPVSSEAGAANDASAPEIVINTAPESTVVEETTVEDTATSEAIEIQDANLGLSSSEAVEQENIEPEIFLSVAVSQSQVNLANVAPTATGIVDEEQYVIDSESISAEDSEILSTSEYNYNSQSAASESMSEALDTAQSEYTSASEAYHNSGYDNEGLDAQEQVVKGRQDKERAQCGTIASTTKELTTSNYYNLTYARGLAQELIKYKLLQDGMVIPENLKNIKMEWQGSGYDNKYLIVQYLDTNKVYHEEYYDYVTCDKEGKSMFQWEQGSVIENGKSIHGENYAPNVGGINIVKKNYEFTTEQLLKDKGKATERPFNYQLNYTENGKTIKVEGTRYVVQMKPNSAGKYKGTDYYTVEDYATDVNLRKTLPTIMSSLADAINNIISEQAIFSQSVANSASEFIAASENRAASLSERAFLSDLASTYKSESLSSSEMSSQSESFLASEMLSQSESESASEALLASQTPIETEMALEPEVVIENEYGDSVSITDMLTSTQADVQQVTVAGATESTAARAVVASVFSEDDASLEAPADLVTPAEAGAPVQANTATVITPIGNNQVPLAVTNIEDPVEHFSIPKIAGTSNTSNTSETTIEDEVTARGGGIDSATHNAMISTGSILAGVAAFGKVRLDIKRLKNKND